jgi:hypothetical protein
MNFKFYKMSVICWLAVELLASQEGLCSMEWRGVAFFLDYLTLKLDVVR